jgi:metal-dependent amidase/aminoacylase/carboxypeptidase family protein
MVAVAGLRETIDEIMPGVVADRRDLHEHPELAYQEVRTSGIVAERLASLGVEEIRTGIAQTGVTGLIRGGKGPAGRCCCGPTWTPCRSWRRTRSTTSRATRA